MGLCLALLAGIYSSTVMPLPPVLCVVFGALLLFMGICCLRQRRSALFCAVGVMMLTGNLLCGHALSLRDAPTQPGVRISGVVQAVIRTHRVMLTDVQVEDGESPSRPVVVTLMLEDGEQREAAQVGQRVSGKGRLFAQREKRNPGGINARVQALCDGYELSGYILPGWQATGAARVSMREILRKVRECLLSLCEQVFGDDAPLFEAVLLGERDSLEGDVVAAMRLTGTAHLLTVSGLHLSLIASALSAVLHRLKLGRWQRLVLTVLVLGLFTGLTGGAPGTVRAFIMASLRALAKCRGRRYEPLTALSFAAMAMTLANPVLALNASFQFSFFVVLGMLLLGTRVREAIRRVPGLCRMPRLAGALSMSLCAQVSALPMQLLLYGYVPLLALPMNMLSGLMMPLLMLGGFVSLLLGCVWLPAAQAAAQVFSLLPIAFEHMTLAAASVPGAALRLPAPFAVTLCPFALLLALCGVAVRFGRGRRRAALLVAAAMALLYLPRVWPQCCYVQLDVGQGDAALLRNGRHAVLVDVGPAASYDALRYLRHEGLFVDAVVLSHLDADHAGALSVLLDSEVQIGRIVMAQDAQAQEDISGAVEAALFKAQESGIAIDFVMAGDRIVAGDVSFDVLSPSEGMNGANARSLVLLTQCRGMRLLLTGDLPSNCEMEDAPDIDVLKVAHHGSKNATSAEFLRSTSPEIALISVGAGNYYGHPTQRVLDDLAAVGAQVYRTDECGCITVIPTKNGVHVRLFVR